MSQFTKLAIINTFMSLLDEKPFDKITVTDIVNTCGINRNTFYYYYQDIYSLIHEIFNIETEKILKNTTSYSSLQDAFLKATKFAHEHKRAIFHLYNSINKAQIENYLYSVIGNVIQSFIESEAAAYNINEEDIKIIATFYTHAFVGISLSWISEGMKTDIEAYIKKATVLFDGNLQNSFYNSQRLNNSGS